MKKEEGREASYCQNIVSDRGDRCLFNFIWARRLFCNVFPFPVCKAELIGDWYENRQGAPNTIIFLIFRQYYWRTEAPCANRSGGPNKKIKLLAHCVWSALPIGGGGHRCANILADRTGFCVACHIKRIKRGGPNSSVRFAYFQANRLFTQLYKQETEIR